jgi:hypothetical protein
MSDIKMVCPSCDGWSTAVGVAFRDDEPCPYCGLPAEAARLVLEAQERHVNDQVLRRLMDAETRAIKAEAEVSDLRHRIASARALLEDDDG